MRVRRSIMWFAIAAFLLVVLRSLPSGSRPRRVPPTVTVQGLSRTEAEFLYGHNQYILNHRWRRELLHGHLIDAWEGFQRNRYRRVERMTKNQDGSVSVMVVFRHPTLPADTNDMRVTGTWPGKKKNND